MSNIIDLAGKRFGRLVAISYSGKGRWLCNCDCGNSKEIRSNALTTGATVSCGCLKREQDISNLKSNRPIDMIGKKFGNLFVIKLDHINKGKRYWLCHCDCGNNYVTEGSALRKGHVKSCGCLSKVASLSTFYKNNLPRKNFLLGQTFGRLTVIKEAGRDKAGSVLWECRCECGNKKTATSYALTSGNCKSCGCISKEKMSELGKRNWKNNLAISHANHKRKYSDEELYYRRFLKDGAEKRGFNCDLSFEEFFEIIKKPCTYCGEPPVDRAGIKSLRIIANGIDRIDSNKGYIKGNCVPCCPTCNYSKRTMSTKEFSDWIKKVYDYFIKDKGTRSGVVGSDEAS